MPEFDIEVFKIFIPKLKWWVEEEKNLPLLNLAVKEMSSRLNYSMLSNVWDEAISLAVAHFIIITSDEFAQSTDADATAGGVMKSRNVSGVSYDYDIEYYVQNHPAYKYWNTTGYGRRLIDLIQQQPNVRVIMS